MYLLVMLVGEEYDLFLFFGLRFLAKSESETLEKVRKSLFDPATSVKRLSAECLGLQSFECFIDELRHMIVR